MPSAQFNDSLANAYRKKMAEEIEARKDRLVDKPNDRDGGYIRGLMNALLLLDEVYADMNSESRPMDRRSNQETLS